MKTAIIYASLHGTTRRIVQQLSEILGEENTDIFDLQQNAAIDLNPYDTIILGGSIHAGSIQMNMIHFIRNKFQDLLRKELGLLLCCLNEPEFEKQFEDAFPEELRKHAKAICFAGGELHFEKMNPFEKAVISKRTGITVDVSRINRENILQFAENMKHTQNETF